MSRRRGGRKEGLSAARTAIELGPDDPIGLIAAGDVELSSGRFRHAARRYEEALALDPNDRVAQLNLAQARKARGHLGSAFGEVDALLELDPQDEAARSILDEVVYTTLVHLTWVALVLLWIVGGVRGM